MIETGFELLDAIINNPMQSILLFGKIIIIHQIFFKHEGLFYDIYRDWKHNLESEIDNSLSWLERREDTIEGWLKKQTKKQWLKYELTILSCVYLPLLIWDMFFI